MEVIRVAMVEDESEVSHQLRKQLQHMEQTGVSFSIAVFSDAESFLASYQCNYDIVLMDIMLPGMNGMEAAQQLRKKDGEVVLIFITNMAHFAVQGYEVSALDFVVKPVSPAVFEAKMTRALQAVKRRQGRTICLEKGGNNVYLSTRDICYVEVAGHELCYHTPQEEYQEWGSMKKAAAELEPDGFLRCHSSFLVNPRHILRVDGMNLYMTGGTQVPISHPKRKEFMQALTEWMGE